MAQQLGLPIFHVTPKAIDDSHGSSAKPFIREDDGKVFLRPCSPSHGDADRRRWGDDISHEPERVWAAGSLEGALLKVRRREAKKHDGSRQSKEYTIVMIFPPHKRYAPFDNAFTAMCASIAAGGSSRHAVLIHDPSGPPIDGLGLVELSIGNKTTPASAKARVMPQNLGRPLPRRSAAPKVERKNALITKSIINSMHAAIMDAVGGEARAAMAKGGPGTTVPDAMAKGQPLYHVSPFTLGGGPRPFQKDGADTYIRPLSPSHADEAARGDPSRSPDAVDHDPLFGWFAGSLVDALEKVVTRESNASIDKYTVAVLFPAHDMYSTFDNFYTTLYANLGGGGVTIHPVLIDAPRSNIDGLIVFEVTVQRATPKAAKLVYHRPLVGTVKQRGFGCFESWFGALRTRLASVLPADDRPLLVHVVPKRFKELHPAEELQPRSIPASVLEEVLYDGAVLDEASLTRLLWAGGELEEVLRHVVGAGPPPDAWTIVIIDPTHPDFFNFLAAPGARFRTSAEPLRLKVSSGVLIAEVCRAVKKVSSGPPKLVVEVQRSCLSSTKLAEAAMAKQAEKASDLGEDLGLIEEQYRKLLSLDSFKCRVLNPKFREQLRWFVQEFLGGDASRLPAAMCNSLAKRLTDAEFREQLRWFVNDILDGDASRLPTAMCGSLAKRLNDAEFRKQLRWFVDTFLGGDASRLSTAMCNSLAKRLTDAEFRTQLRWFVDTLLEGDVSRLPTAMCDSLAKQLTDAEFRTQLRWFVDKCLGGDVSSLPTAMCDGLAARLTDTAFRGNLLWFIRTILDGDAALLPSIMCGGLAARLGNIDFCKQISAILCLAVECGIDKATVRKQILSHGSPFLDVVSDLHAWLKAPASMSDRADRFARLASSSWTDLPLTVKDLGLQPSQHVKKPGEAEAIEGGGGGGGSRSSSSSGGGGDGGSSSGGGGDGGSGKRKRGESSRPGGKRAKQCQWTAGQLVEVRGLASQDLKGSWWRATIRGISQGTVEVEYMDLNGEALEGGEAVQKARLRPPVVAPPLAFRDLRVDDLVEFDLIGECWWEVQVLAVSRKAVRVMWEGRIEHEIGAADVATKLRRRPA